jgi:cyclic pyranopterin phosphate synthase
LDDVVPAAEIVERIGREMPLRPLGRAYRGEVAQRYVYEDGSGEIGVIASVTQPFCGDCTRARLSADGKLYTCLFAFRGHDFRSLLRGGRTDAEISDLLRGIWSRRDDRYSELRTAATGAGQSGGGERKVEMSYIGG